MDKTIYVVGGTNGVGKSTIREELLGAEIPYINADFIAKEFKRQHASLMLAELARQYGSDQIKKYIAEQQSFAFENNLHEAKTFQWLQELQNKGYRIEIFYVGVNNLQITTKRIEERVKRGEHYVPANEVFARYENGIKLMMHYFAMPDTLLLIDNTQVPITCLKSEKGSISFLMDNAPSWVAEFVSTLQTKGVATTVKSLNTIDEVRRLYAKTKRKDDDKNTTDSK